MSRFSLKLPAFVKATVTLSCTLKPGVHPLCRIHTTDCSWSPRERCIRRYPCQIARLWRSISARLRSAWELWAEWARCCGNRLPLWPADEEHLECFCSATSFLSPIWPGDVANSAMRVDTWLQGPQIGCETLQYSYLTGLPHWHTLHFFFHMCACRLVQRGGSSPVRGFRTSRLTAAAARTGPKLRGGDARRGAASQSESKLSPFQLHRLQCREVKAVVFFFSCNQIQTNCDEVASLAAL